MYTGYEAHRFVPETREDIEILNNLETRNPGILFLHQIGSEGAPVDILFPPHLQTDLLKSLSDKMPSSLISDDLESLMDHDSHIALLETLEEGEFPFNVYWDLPTFMSFYTQMETLHPDFVKTVTYGTSTEGNPLIAAILSNQQPPPVGQPVMLIDAGMHAREWVTGMSCAHCLNDIVTNRELYQSVLKDFTIMMVCNANPDGLKYSWDTNRLWRKTRATNESLSTLCVGVDPNRNWDFGHTGEGSSQDPCSDIFAGTRPFSIPETSALKSLAESQNVVSYVSMHSYSQLILLSFGCNSVGPNRYPGFDNDLLVAQEAANTLKNIHGTEYQCGNSNEILYQACGTSADWFKGVYGTQFAYTYELRDTGTFGFVVPATQLLETCEETTASLRTLHQTMAAQILKSQKENE